MASVISQRRFLLNDNDPDPDRARLDREREFHDQRFSGAVFDEPRLKYYAALQECDDRHFAAIRARAQDADVLEYGCADGVVAVTLAPVARSVCGIDISGVAIEQASRRAEDMALANTRFLVADAMATGFPDASFDLVFGSGIIHHLDVDVSLREIHRILRPGGIAIFKEPMVGNAVLRLYRRATPDTRSADEHPLTAEDLELAGEIFPRTRFSFFGLFTIGVVPFRNSVLKRPLYRALAAIDRVLFWLPTFRAQAWYVGMEMRR